MKLFLLRLFSCSLAAIMALTAVPVFADELLIAPRPQEPAANSMICYWNADNTPEDAVKLVETARAIGFDRIICAIPKETQERFSLLYPFRQPGSVQTNSKDCLAFLAALSQELAACDMGMSLLCDPFALRAGHPAGQFLFRLAAENDQIAFFRDSVLRMDLFSEQNQETASYEMQKYLAAAVHIDELIFYHDSFAGSNLSQVTQAQLMASFVESFSGSDLSLSVYYRENDEIMENTSGMTPLTLSDKLSVDRIYPVLSGSVAAVSDSTFEKHALRWQNVSADLDVIPVIDTDAFPDGESSLGAVSRIYLAQQMGFSSLSLSNDFSSDPGSVSYQQLLSYAFSGGISLLPEDFSLSVPQTLAVTRPESSMVTVSADSYFLMGTSDPAQPLFFDEEEVERTTENGCFGIYLTDIPYGSSTHTFRQGSTREIVTVNRPEPNSSVAKISTITQSSMFPEYGEAVKVGEKFTVSCIAPAGAAVTAFFQGQSVRLKQVAAAQTGVPARFTGTLTMMHGGNEDATVKIGKVTYSMWYGGKYSSYSSTGELYAVGEKARLAVSAKDYINSIYGDYNIEADFYTTVYQGACDYVTQVDEDYYKLSCGGYLAKSYADILEGTAEIEKTASAVTYRTDERGETLTVTGAAHIPYKADLDENVLSVTLWNLDGVPTELGQVESDLYEKIQTVINEDGSVTFLFTRKDNAVLWGYSVEYNGDDLVIYSKKAPSLSSVPGKPLDGLVIVIDSGHGGEDPGALGVAGTSGPAERELNFITAYACAQMLESMGAQVHMVAPHNERLDYEGRMDPARTLRADFFISFHHNSTAETTDSRKFAGTEVYYHEDGSRLFAENLLASITNATGRTARGAYQDYYRVTRMTYAPSVMLELGFVVNPAEYESLCRPISVYQTAIGVAQGIMDTVENAE